jgi:hypothetical protein
MSGSVLNTQGFGNRPEGVEIPFVTSRAPSPSDVNYPIGKRWITPPQNAEFVLTSKASFYTSTTSIWSLLSSTSGSYYISAGGITPPMVNGSITVSNPAILSSSYVFTSGAVLAGVGIISVSNVSNGSFTLTGESGETSSFYYIVVN